MPAPGSKLSVPSAAKANAAFVAIRGELTLANLAPFRQEVLEALSANSTLVLGFDSAEYLDATAFQCICALRLEASLRGISLVIESVPESIRRDAALLGMAAVIDGIGPPDGSSSAKACVGGR